MGFLLEDKLKELEDEFEKTENLSFVVGDRQIMTGQNPASVFPETKK